MWFVLDEAKTRRKETREESKETREQQSHGGRNGDKEAREENSGGTERDNNRRRREQGGHAKRGASVKQAANRVCDVRKCTLHLWYSDPPGRRCKVLSGGAAPSQ